MPPSLYLSPVAEPTAGLLNGQDTPIPRVLVAESSRWACGHRIAIALAQAGCEVAAVCPQSDHPLLKTHAVGRISRYSPINPLDSLLAAIEATNPQIIIPCDDLAVIHLHELHARALKSKESAGFVADVIERSLGSPEGYSIVSSRDKLLEIARDEGILTPLTGQLRTVDDLKRWQMDHALPWVLKIDRTWGGRGVRIVNTADEAQQLFHEMTHLFGDLRAAKKLIVNRDPIWIRPAWNRCPPAITVQRYVYGRAANCGVVSWRGQILAGIAVEAIDTQGRTGPASVVRVLDNPTMLLCAEQIARRLNLSGFFGLDFVIEEDSGLAYLIEMNPRCTPVCHLQLGKGRDLIEALCAQLFGRPVHESPSVTTNELIAYFPQAWLSGSKHLEASYQDIPKGEPELIQMLLKPALPHGRRSASFHYVLLLVDRLRRIACRVLPKDRTVT